MKKLLIVLLVIISLSIRIDAQQPTIYLPIIFNNSSGQMANNYPIFAITNGTERINLLDSGSGIQLADPYWSPNVAQNKGGGTHINPQTTSGQSLVAAEYDNVIETIPLRITGPQGNVTLENLRRLFSLSVNAQGYWTRIFEQDQVWLEIRADCDNMLTAYSVIYTLSIGGISSPYTTPFINQIDKSEFDTVNLILEREPFFSPLQPGEIIGPLYNLIKNPDFELWTQPPGIADTQPDSWDDLENNMFGTNNRSDDSKWGNYSLKVEITGSGAANSYKGVTQVISDTQDNTEYTVIAWVKSEGIGKGTGRILINYSTQLELYNESDSHDWTMYTGKITTGINDVVSINCEVLATDANTTGTIYFDGLMFLKGDFVDYAEDNLLPYMTSSHIVNHWDNNDGGKIEQGDINFVDVWNVPGDVDSLIRLEFINNTDIANYNNPVEKFERVRIGLRRTGNVLDVKNYYDTVGESDTTASSDGKITNTVDTFWTEGDTYELNGIADVTNNVGRYKAYARLWDAGPHDLNARLKYYTGLNVNLKVLPQTTVQIMNSWTIVDLTQNDIMVWGDKTDTDLGRLGYIVELIRDDDSFDSYLDYVLLMPTDGGFIDAEISPGIAKGNSLVVDGSKAKIKVTGTYTRSGLMDSFTFIDNNEIFGLHNFLGNMYAAMNGGLGDTATYIYKKEGRTWVRKYNNAVPAPRGGMEIYDRKLYVGLYNSVNGAQLLSTIDGETWTVETTLLLADAVACHAIKPFNNLLFFSTSNALETINRVYTWDGTTATHVYSIPNVSEFVVSFEVYNGRLFAGTTGGEIHVYNPVTNLWALSYDTTQTDVRTLKKFGDYLYAGTGANGNIYRYDGYNWTLVYTSPDITTFYSMAVQNNKLFAGGEGGNRTLIQTSNGTDWTDSYPTEALRVMKLHSYDGILYVGLRDSVNSSIFEFADDPTVSYGIVNFKGGQFYAPPRTKYSDSRHRYFFNYDRENYINNIDDKALIGIGYRPRYLSLISKEGF